MSQYMLTDGVLYVGFLLWFFLSGWYVGAAWLIFPVLLAIFISVALTVISRHNHGEHFHIEKRQGQGH